MSQRNGKSTPASKAPLPHLWRNGPARCARRKAWAERRVSPRAPECVAEEWRLAGRRDARAYLLTARGFGNKRESQVWLQMQLVIDGDRIERHWRRVAARPF